MVKTHLIEKKTEWINSILPGETKTGYFKNRKELDSVSTLVGRFNNGIGMDKGLRISVCRNWVDISYTLTCNIVENKNDLQDEDEEQHYPITEIG